MSLVKLNARSGLTTGSVLQVVTANKTGSSQNSTSSTYADVTNLTANITPSSTSNYLLIMVQVSTQHFGNNATTDPNGRVKLTDGSTDFVETSYYHYVESNDKYHLGSHFMQHYYNPNTTSQVSLKLQMKAVAGRFGVFAEDDGATIRPTNITVMEIAA
tara:strand:- start:338 stop:814 length:477 start_codon:yes stop_codon:yes gene_type:complete